METRSSIYIIYATVLFMETRILCTIKNIFYSPSFYWFFLFFCNNRKNVWNFSSFYYGIGQKMNLCWNLCNLNYFSHFAFCLSISGLLEWKNLKCFSVTIWLNVSEHKFFRKWHFNAISQIYLSSKKHWTSSTENSIMQTSNLMQKWQPLLVGKNLRQSWRNNFN